jgi:hypothetical protein
VAYAIKRTFEIDPPLSVSADTVKALQDGLASSWGVLEASVVGDFTGDTLVGLRVEMLVEAPDGSKAGGVARRAIREAGQLAGLPERSFRVTSGSGREV